MMAQEARGGGAVLVTAKGEDREAVHHFKKSVRTPQFMGTLTKVGGEGLHAHDKDLVRPV